MKKKPHISCFSMQGMGIILFFFLSPNRIIAQEDSIIAENTFKHQIVDGKRTIKKMVIEQKTYNLQRQLIRQVFFDSIPKAKEYVFYFYHEGLLFSEETYNYADSIRNIRRFIYNTKGMPVEEKIYNYTDTKITKTYIIKNYYDDTTLVKKVISDRKNKKMMQSVTVINPTQRITTTKYNRQYNPLLKNESIITTYSDNQIFEVRITRKKRNGSVQDLQINYEYDVNSGILLKENWRDFSGNIIKTVVYECDADENVKSKSILDKDEKFIEYYSYECKKYLITLGNQIMYDLKENNR